MDARSWPRIRALFERAIERPRNTREAFVRGRTDEPPGIRDEVLRLLESDAAETGFLSPPPVDTVHAAGAVIAPRPGDSIGSFRLEQELGSGGMGTVFAARQSQPSRVVALKVMRSGLRSPRARRRFEVEAEILGSLRHPGIATIYEAGVHRGADGRELPFFAMELVEGARNVVEHAREARLGVDERVRLVAEVCDAVHHAHQRGVVHRDLKPGNVLVDTAGRPRVIDYGVARVRPPGSATEDRASHTRTGDVFGTLDYMSPEQLAGDEVDIRTDVYSLGVVLYELLAGSPPHSRADASVRDLVESACHEAARPPSERVPDLPRELDWVVLRAIERRSDDRYGSAAELADDLRRYLSDEPVRAGPPTRRYRVRKFIARHKSLVFAVGGFVLALVGGMLATAWQAHAASEAAERAERSRRAEAAQRARAETALRRERALVDGVERMFRSASSVERGREITVFEVLDTSRERLDEFGSDPVVRGSMQSFFASLFRAIGCRERAVILEEAAVRSLESLGDAADPVDLAWQRALLAEALDGENRHEEAEPLHALAVAVLEGTDPEDREASRRYVRALTGRALHNADVGRADAARGDFRAAIDAAGARLGEDAVERALASAELGFHLALRARSPEGLERLRAAHEQLERTHGPAHRLTLDVAARRALALDAHRRFGDALALRRVLVEHTESAYGVHHANFSTALQHLAASLWRTGVEEEAIRAARRAVDLSAEHGWGVRHEVDARATLSSFLVPHGDLHGAREQLGAAIHLLDEVDGRAHEHPAWVTLVLRASWVEVLSERSREAVARLEAVEERVGLDRLPQHLRAIDHAIAGVAAADPAGASAEFARCVAIVADWGLQEFVRLDPMFFDPLEAALRDQGRDGLVAVLSRARAVVRAR